MGVSVDQARKDERAAGVDGSIRVVSGIEIGALADGANGVAGNGHGAVNDQLALAVHGEQRSAFNEKVHFFRIGRAGHGKASTRCELLSLVCTQAFYRNRATVSGC